MIRSIPSDDSKRLQHVLQQSGCLPPPPALLKLVSEPNKWIGAYAVDGRLACAGYANYNQNPPLICFAIPDQWRSIDNTEESIEALTAHLLTDPAGDEVKTARLLMIGEKEPIEVNNRAVSDDEPHTIERTSEPKKICWECIGLGMSKTERVYDHDNLFGNVASASIGLTATKKLDNDSRHNPKKVSEKMALIKDPAILPPLETQHGKNGFFKRIANAGQTSLPLF